MKRRYQYSLKSLLVAVTLVAVLCSLLVTFTPYGLALLLATTLPGAIAGRYTGQRRLGWLIGMLFGLRWALYPLVFALITSDEYPFPTLLAVAIASVLGGARGGYVCAEVEL